jgi:large subunit ribosomal protein L13
MTTTKTFSPRPRDIERRWYVVDADGAVLGRLASEVAKILRGKHKPIFAPHADTGDHVIVVNARRIRLTGGKEEKKIYYRHSGYPGGLTEVGYARLLERRPALAVEKAIRGMLPKNRLGRAMGRKLAVYEGPDHPHRAQTPVPLALGEIPAWGGLPQPKPQPAPAPKKARPAERPASADSPEAKKPAPRRRSAAGGAKPASKSKRVGGKPAPKTTARSRGKKETKES